MNDIFSLELLQFSVSDIIDILLISFVVYKVSIWLKGTKAVNLFKGILLVVAIAGVALVLELTTVWWLITNLFGIGITALLIIFQPELRKMLEELGRGNFLSKILNKEDNKELEKSSYMETIVETVIKLSKNKTGALIIIEGNDSLKPIVETGIILEAKISSELLENIFYTNAPMHDGAVVIKEGLILAASCILPLSSAGVSSDLGTRHRAGLGVSEEYDSISIISSEETGKISLCVNGHLLKAVTEEMFREKLLGSKKKKRKRGN